ncbi:restriction endonuclease subunit S [Epibacterium ulvae]|uniref:restriction endonuclease subunit S n=1 Tax=Epibacterium ulvae TaxID=1156985 RepID=UPI001BFCC869|nr:restriction endonuclease subunit S [Epibacterium ulvae]MBT8155146.1 restriction endonuclease subunit S [Epibacterium ulvae]
MSADWPELSIEELKANSKNAIAMGPFGSRIKAENFVNSGVPVIKGGNLNGDFILEDKFDFLTEEKATELQASNAYRRDIVITHRGTIGQVGIIPDNSKYERYVASQSQLKVTLDQEKINPFFVYYFLRSPVGQHRLLTNASQVGVPAIAQASSSVKSIMVPCPDRDIQDKIVEISLNLDHKIELNRQTNQTLEEMAQAVFKSWFVDFEPTRAKIKAIENGQDPTRAAMTAIAGKTIDQLETLSPDQIKSLTATADLFPDTLVTSELGEIPDGWEAKPLYETAEYVNGAAFKSVDFCDPEEGLPIIKIAELKQGIYDGTKYTLKEVKQRHFITNDDVLYSWSGSPETSLEVFKWFGGDGWLNQHIFKLNFASDEQKYFTYYLLKHMKPVLIAIAQDKQTTGLGHVTVADMKRLLVTYPDDALLQEFKKRIAPLYEQCSTIEKENITLSEIRDALLPKLLSGEIEINGEVAQ